MHFGMPFKKYWEFYLIFSRRSDYNSIMTQFFHRCLICLLSVCLANLSISQSIIPFDVVLEGGRVIDPETGLDALRNIGIRHGRIEEISSNPLLGQENIKVDGLVVTPGFIDLHVHGISNIEQEFQVHDGVTTALELEAGVPFLTAWIRSRQGKALINYGASASWPYNRAAVLGEFRDQFADLEKEVYELGWNQAKVPISISLPSNHSVLSPDQTPVMMEGIKAALREGALGIGVPVGYLPGASREEIFRVYQFASKWQAPIFTHVRPGNTLAIQQAISDAAVTGAPLHIVHINSMALSEIELAIEMVHSAQKRGLDITTELYPYTAGSTRLESARFDEGWQEDQGITYTDLQWVSTGERLSKESFEKYRKEGGWVIIHKMKPEWISAGVAAEGVIIASDGMPYAPTAHPRTAGTFSRVLGRYVRQQDLLPLNEAIKKMTLLPARRLENIAPSMRFKGRIQVGCDADLVVFDPESIIDKATYEQGLAFSKGIQYVLVNGVFILKNGDVIESTFPGQPIYGKYKR
jgi:dihydroorotase